MRNKLKSPAIGAAYSLLILLFAWLLLFCLSDLVRLFLSPAQLRTELMGQVLLALEQLKYVPILPPILPALVLGLGIGWLLKGRITTKRRKILLIVLAVLLFLPLTAAALWFTTINGIRLGALLQSLLPVLPALL